MSAESNNNPFNLVEGTPPVSDLRKLYRSNFDLREELDRVVRMTGYGTLGTINYLTLHGFNYHRLGQQLVHNNRDHMGFTFFTRPCLNLSYDNLSMVREFIAMRDSKPDSILGFIRDTLDPQGPAKDDHGYGAISYGEPPDGSMTVEGKQNYMGKATPESSLNSQLVDHRNPFIPVLSNTLVSLSGWKDIAMNDYTSKNGINNEQWSMPDGFYYKTEVFELSGSFRNIEGDPVSKMFQYWIHYMAMVRELGMLPYNSFIECREYDFNTRIYRLIMDHTKTYVQRIAATIAYPISVPYSNLFNYSADKNFADTNAEIPVTFKCIGAEYDDPILYWEFNEAVRLFNPDLEVDYNNYDNETNSMILKKNSGWRKLRPHEKLLGTYLATPLINYITHELEWWVSPEVYERYIKLGNYTLLELDKKKKKDGNNHTSGTVNNIGAGDSVTTMMNPTIGMV